MIFQRQKLLLGLLSANGGILGKLDFQKLLFLYTKNCEESPSYEFVPFKKGCYSFTSHADKRKLTEMGFLSSEEIWHVTDAASTIRIPPDVTLRVKNFSENNRQLRGDDLVAFTYRKYPYWAINSEIADKILADDVVALSRISKAKQVVKKARLSTIGYEGRSFENYLNILISSGVSILCDVRKNPFSHKFGFSKNTLSEACGKLGIKYEHLPELGILSENRKNLSCLEDYQKLFGIYEETVLKTERKALEMIASWINDGESVALTCFERAPQYCHRSRVANQVSILINAEVEQL